MDYNQTAGYILERINHTTLPKPRTAVVLGSGLGKMGQQIADALIIPYSEIPNFQRPTAVGHQGNLIIGTLNGSPVIAMQGRFHYYEGYTMEQVTFPIRVFARMGISTLLVSNAAGGVNPDYHVGDLMVITDHLNFMPNPLLGPNKDDFGPRFPDMTFTYSPRLRQVADQLASEMKIALRHGIYAAQTGPTYETPAEYRMYRMMGADAVGMSTVPEVIVARHCGIEVFGMSVITNQANNLKEGALNDADEVVRQADAAADRMTALFSHLISRA